MMLLATVSRSTTSHLVGLVGPYKQPYRKSLVLNRARYSMYSCVSKRSFKIFLSKQAPIVDRQLVILVDILIYSVLYKLIVILTLLAMKVHFICFICLFSEQSCMSLLFIALGT